MTRCRCCRSLVTGCYGCHAREQAEQTEPTKLTERLWFVFVLLVCFTSLSNMFFWLTATNDSVNFNRDLAEMTGLWWRYYVFFMALSCVLCVYPALLLIFAFLHITVGQQLILHGLHKVGVILDVSLVIAMLVFPSTVLKSNALWHFVPQGLMFVGPFLHLIGVVILTGLSWFVAGGMGTIQRKGSPVRDLAVWYLIALTGLYVSPIFISSPCLLKYDDLPPKPLIFAYKGAEQLAPENTLIAFELALDVDGVRGIHTHARISYDGVPYIIHDDTLVRTTNVEDVFPERFADRADSFTIAELKQLNAGSWFITSNPYGTSHQLTQEEIIRYRKQKIPTVEEMLLQVVPRNTTLLIDFCPPPEDHPFHDSWLELAVNTILKSVVDEDNLAFRQAANNDTKYTFLINGLDDRRLITAYNDVPFSEVRNNMTMNVTTNVWTVNENWLFSLFWCAGATSVSTSSCQTLLDESAPLWQLSPLHYLVMWILFDVVSFVWVVIIFIIQISRRRRQLRELGEEPPERYNYRHFMALEELSKKQKTAVLL